MTPAAFNTLSPAEVTKLLAGGTSKPRRFMIVKSATGLEVTKFKPSEVGSFEGRVGTTARSRKGRTYRKPNGSRAYVPGNPDVVAYRA